MTHKILRPTYPNSQPSLLHRVLKLLVLSLVLFTASCFVAKKEAVNTPHCKLVTDTWELELHSELPPGFRVASESCNSPECLLAFVVSSSITVTSSFIVSGSIVLVGNTLHWIEKQGRCKQSTIQTALNSISNTFAELGGSFIGTKDELFDIFSNAEKAADQPEQ